MEARLDKAATTQGTIKAGTVIPAQPDECTRHMDRVVPSKTEKPRDTILRWEFVADNEDRKIDRCNLFNANLRANFGDHP